MWSDVIVPVAWIYVFQVLLSGGQQQFYPKTSTVPGGGNGEREDNRNLVEVKTKLSGMDKQLHLRKTVVCNYLPLP